MNRDYLKQIMTDQKDTYLSNPAIERNYPLEDHVNYCFVGIRRTGKSYMMYQQIRHLQENGIPLSQIVYVNFEDERLLEMSADDLNVILEIGLEMAGVDNRPYLFLDEIQNIKGWEKFVRRIADMKYRINITGSNSKMLSSEIASTLGGRFMIVDIYPYSFPEYLLAQGKNKNYLDILITRNKITNDFAVRLILKKIAESITKPLSFNRLGNILKSAGAAIGKQTVINYVGYMMESYMLFTLQNYAAKLIQKETSPKYYFMDTGLLGLMLMDCSSAQLENLVAIELIRRFGREKVFYFENNVEIDFYIPEEKLAIQVSMQVLDQIETREREIGAFLKLRNFIEGARCILITNSEEAELDCDGIHVSVVPAWKWLL